MRIVLMGMPGVGKGTQASRLRGALHVLHVSTGDILREAINAGTALGKRVRESLDSGALVPDDLMAELIADRLSRSDTAGGFILDGFPRTAEQVLILDRVLETLSVKLDGVFLLTATEDEIVSRLSGRRICPGCGEVYHVNNRQPKSAGVCDKCGSALVQRPDDTESVILERLEVYKNQTLPVVETYRARGVLIEIDGTGDAAAVFERLREAVGQS
jgi:adenylate kinase